MTLYIILFILGFVGLAKSSDLLVRSLTILSRVFRIPEYTIAFLFMSMATSIPELFVGLSSAVNKISELSFGNVMGANLINITIILGLVILLGKGLKVESKISKRNFWLISGLTLLPFLLALDGVVSRGDGILLLLLFVFYISRIRKESEHFTKTMEEQQPKKFTGKIVFRNISYFVLGVAMLIISAYVIVRCGENIAEAISFNTLAFGLIFIALGTSLPEMAFGLRARILKHDSMVVGNSFGSIAFNSTLIVGLVSVISPIYVTAYFDLFVTAILLIVALLFFQFFLFSKSFLSRKEGFALVMIYVIFLVIQYFRHFA